MKFNRLETSKQEVARQFRCNPRLRLLVTVTSSTERNSAIYVGLLNEILVDIVEQYNLWYEFCLAPDEEEQEITVDNVHLMWTMITERLAESDDELQITLFDLGQEVELV